jgi:hypothetical protein
VAGCCERGNELSGSRKSGDFLNKLRNYPLINVSHGVGK